MSTLARLARQGFVAATVALGSIGAWAEPSAIAKAAAVDEARLDGLRGGFDIAQGLRASFGIERTTTINGALVVSQSIQIADLSRVSADQAAQLQSLLSNVSLIRNGPGNTFAPIAGTVPGGATVIQNTLDGQAIKSMTVINATTNSLGALQALNAAAALRNALIAPILSRP